MSKIHISYAGVEKVEAVEEPEIIVGDGDININTATAEELMTLPGIGETRAADIIAFREANDGFISITQLRLVRGIGENIYENIRDKITIGK